MSPGITGSRAKSLLHVCVATILIFSGSAHSASTPNPAAFDTGSDNQLGLTFTPDGSTAFWVAWNGDWGRNDGSLRQIYTSRLRHGEWSTPIPTDFSGNHSDNDPFVSPDGRWLYFVSDRPTNDDDKSTDANIWRYSLVEKDDLEYVSINSSLEEYSPVVTASGAVYFASNRHGGQGKGDLYRAEPMHDGFGSPQPLGAAFNTPDGEWNLWVSADENEIIFEASSRPTNVSTPGDLYYSWRTAAGWTPAIPAEPLNSRNSDLMPRLHPDGETLYYTSAPISGHARIVNAKWGRLREQLRFEFAPTLMVANRSSHEVTFVDLSRGEVVAGAATGEGPHLLSNVSEGALTIAGRIWVANATDGSVSILDPPAGTVVEHIDSVCGFPIALSQDAEKQVWLACFDSAELVSIDPDSFVIKRRIDLDDQPLNLLAHPNRQLAYVSLPRRNAIAEIDLDSGKEVRRIDVGVEPDGLRWAPPKR